MKKSCHPPVQHRPSISRRLRLALENRWVFDGAVLATVAESVAEPIPVPSPAAEPTPLPTFTAHTDTIAYQAHSVEPAAPLPAPAAATTPAFAVLPDPQPTPISPTQNAHSLVFVDASVKDLQPWLANYQGEVIVLDDQHDGVAQIAAALDGRTDINAIHILSHGAQGQLHLGDSTLTTDSISGQHADALAQIKSALSSDADVLVYGCDVGDGTQGQDFLSALAAATGADVAASTDATGNATIGGNWQLEASTGDIDTTALNLSDYQGLLAAPTLTDTLSARTTAENTPLAIIGIVVADADEGDQTISLQISAGTLDLASIDGLSNVSGNGTANVTMTGSVTAVNAALNGMTYTPSPNFNGTASLTLSAFDGTSTANLLRTITVTAVNEAPFAAPDTANSTEDQTGSTVGNVLDNDTDADSGDSKTVQGVAVGIVTGPLSSGFDAPVAGSYGTLTLNSDGNYSYALDNNLISVQALAFGQTVTDVFSYTVKDSAGANATTTLTVTITGTNDAPIIIGGTANGLTLPENATDSENPGLSVSSLLTNGSASLATDVDNGTILGIAINNADLSYTNGMTGQVQYRLNGSSIWETVVGEVFLPASASIRFVADLNPSDPQESGIATLSYRAWDGFTTSDASVQMNIDVYSRNDTPTLTPVPLDVNERNSVYISTDQLPLTDPDNKDLQILYRLESVPTLGVLYKNGVQMGVGSLFSQADIAAGNRISYQYTATELLDNATDSFSFSVRDGAGGILGAAGAAVGDTSPRTLNINIQDVNAPISITDTQQSIPEALLTTEYVNLNLRMNDADGDASLMTLTIDSLPDPNVGKLQYFNGTAYVDVFVGLQLTQAALNTQPLRFISSGAEPIGDNARAFFNVSANDHHPTLNNSFAESLVQLDIVAVNDVPIAVTSTLAIAQGGSGSIGNLEFQARNATLTATDPDSAVSARVYTLNSEPTHGVLTLDGIAIGAGSTFTEADLAAGLLAYVNDGYTGADDAFSFSVNDRDGGIGVGTMNIDVTPDQITPIPNQGALTLVAPEGGVLALSNIVLRGSNSYLLASVPEHGGIYLDGRLLQIGDSFTQQDIDAGKVVYVNNGDEPYAYDLFESVDLRRIGGDIGGSSTLTITISPTNDAPLINQDIGSISTNTDGTTLLEANVGGGNSGSFSLQNVSNAVKLSLVNLLVIDNDSPDNLLNYVLDSPPAGGTLSRWNGEFWVALTGGSRFSAQDVRDGEIAYFHNPDSELRNDSISVHLEDGGVVQVGDIVITPGVGVVENPSVTVSDGTNTITLGKGTITRSPTRTINFTIVNVNDAPVANGGSLTVSEGVSNIDNVNIPNNPGRVKVLGTIELNVSDSDNSLSELRYRITSLPTAGTLEIDRGSGYVVLTSADIGTSLAEFTWADLNAGKLRYVQDGSERTSDSFSYAANDLEPLFSSNGFVNINIIPINDPPILYRNNPMIVNEGTDTVITTEFLGADGNGVLVDPDNDPEQVQYRISSTVSHGQLYIDENGTQVLLGAGSAFSLQDIISGKLHYRHDGSEPDLSITNIDDQFSFVLSDSSGQNEPAATFSFLVTPVNDAPQLGNMGDTINYVEGDAALLIDSQITFSDVDLANNYSNFNNGLLSVSLTDVFVHDADQLSIRNQGIGTGQIGYNGETGAVSYGGMVFGVAEGGANGRPLLIRFNSNAHEAEVRALIASIQFANTDRVNPEPGLRTVEFLVNDGGGVANGGIDTVIGTTYINVIRANDAPQLIPVSPVLETASEDNETVVSQVRDILSIVPSTINSSISDTDADAVQGIAITGLSSGNGSWQYSTDNSNWFDIGPVSDNQALLLRATDYIRFIPDGKNADTASVTYRAWDQSSGAPGSYADTTAAHAPIPDDTSAFSIAHDTATLSIYALNDAPQLADTNLNLFQFEDAPAPVGAVGDTLDSLLGGISDVDNGALLGIAIVGADDSQGRWYYSLDGGTNWQVLGKPTEFSAVLLANNANTRLYFQPNADINGTLTAALTIRAWDQTLFQNGDTRVDIGLTPSLIGNPFSDTQPFSKATDTVALTLFALNDAPSITRLEPTITAAGLNNENIPILLGPIFNLSDIDLARLEGSNLGQVTLSVAHGGFVIDPNTGISISAGTPAIDRGEGDWGGGSNSISFIGTLAQLQTALNTARYVPGDDPDTSETITVRFDDLGNNGLGAAAGGSDVHSASSSVVVTGIDPVNDAPTISHPGSVATNEDTVINLGISIAIADVDARTGQVEVVLTIPTGALNLSLVGNTQLFNGALNSGRVGLRGTLADVNNTLDSLTYTPVADANNLNSIAETARSLTITATDLGNGEAGVAVTALSATSNLLININAINDEPSLDVDLATGVQNIRTSPTVIQENTATAITGIVLADPRDSNDVGYGSNTSLVISAA
ncbi:MAG: DUF4347 domain-containing protein, partial [Methylococcaceae bacterium]|nr:DUF4347 domain-containing protein [Methylococcaceae bacterium]